MITRAERAEIRAALICSGLTPGTRAFDDMMREMVRLEKLKRAMAEVEEQVRIERQAGHG